MTATGRGCANSRNPGSRPLIRSDPSPCDSRSGEGNCPRLPGAILSVGRGLGACHHHQPGPKLRPSITGLTCAATWVSRSKQCGTTTRQSDWNTTSRRATSRNRPPGGGGHRSRLAEGNRKDPHTRLAEGGRRQWYGGLLFHFYAAPGSGFASITP